MEKVKGYDEFYNWLDILKNNGHHMNGFVKMPDCMLETKSGKHPRHFLKKTG